VSGPTLFQTPAALLTAGDFVAGCAPEDLVYFLLNVGDGDSQLILLPEQGGSRQAIVVDVLSAPKIEHLLDELAKTPLLPQRPELFALVVATHPHADHIGGMAALLDRFHGLIGEFWEPGFYYTSPTYAEMMRAVGEHGLRHGQPTSGMTRWIGQVKLLVLAPGINLRNRFDSYGVDVNNSSVALKIEFPGRRVTDRLPDGSYVRAPRQSLILGGDAQTLSWAQVMIDFPQLGPDQSLVAKALTKAQGFEPLNSDIFKVPHHASKHGLNLELVEAIAPSISLISSVGGGGKYNFPHLVSVEALREAIEPTSQKGTPHKPDYELGIHYTFGSDDAGAPLGSMALVISPGGRKRELWRFGDRSTEQLQLAAARKFS
jgi:hypothetical protein